MSSFIWVAVTAIVLQIIVIVFGAITLPSITDSSSLTNIAGGVVAIGSIVLVLLVVVLIWNIVVEIQSNKLALLTARYKHKLADALQNISGCRQELILQEVSTGKTSRKHHPREFVILDQNYHKTEATTNPTPESEIDAAKHEGEQIKVIEMSNSDTLKEDIASERKPSAAQKRRYHRKH